MDGYNMGKRGMGRRKREGGREGVERLIGGFALVGFVIDVPDISVTSTCVAFKRSVSAVLRDSSVMDVVSAILVWFLVFCCLG